MLGPDYIVDIDGLRPSQGVEADTRSSRSDSGFQGRPWIAVTWACCSVYSRVYRNRDGSAYEGRCPKCAKQVKACVGEGGTDNRFFTAD